MLAVAAACPVRAPSRYDVNPAWPFEARVIAVAPALGPDSLNGVAFARAFANELASFPGVERVVYPEEMAVALEQASQPGVAGALEAATARGADALIAMRVHDHSPYRPKRIALSVELLSTGPLAEGAPDIEALIRRGRWASDVPYPPDDRHARNVVDMIQRVYDARHEMTVRRMNEYDRAKVEGGFDPGVMTASVEEVFWGFVAQEVVREFIDREMQRRTDVARSGT
jgi:hypothetical protein